MTVSQPVCIVDYARTVIGKFNGALSAVRPDRGSGVGVATACIGVGQGLAVVLET